MTTWEFGMPFGLAGHVSICEWIFGLTESGLSSHQRICLAGTATPRQYRHIL